MNSNEYGYRSEGAFGDGYRGLVEVITYETSELENDDIFDYCIANYELDDELIDQMNEILTNDDLRSEESLVKGVVSDLVAAIGRLVGEDLQYCVWLCDTPEDVIKSYIEDFDDYNPDFSPEDYGITVYKKSSVVVSDLDSEGKLYAYSEDSFNDAYLGDLAEFKESFKDIED